MSERNVAITTSEITRLIKVQETAFDRKISE